MHNQSQLYGWDTEPVEERPSEFLESTGYSVLSSHYDLDHAHRARESRSLVGFKSLLAFCAIALGLGGYALLRLAPLLHA
jgi:hypothetical protein